MAQALCLELLGDIARAEGAIETAERNYRKVIRRWPDLNATTGMVEVSLAELLTDVSGGGRHEEAIHLLDAALKRGQMLNSGCSDATSLWPGSPSKLET